MSSTFSLRSISICSSQWGQNNLDSKMWNWRYSHFRKKEWLLTSSNNLKTKPYNIQRRLFMHATVCHSQQLNICWDICLTGCWAHEYYSRCLFGQWDLLKCGQWNTNTSQWDYWLLPGRSFCLILKALFYANRYYYFRVAIYYTNSGH